MSPQIRLGTFLGIPIGLHYSWFFVAALVGISFSASFRYQFPEMAPGEGFFWAAATALAFFLCILLHELGHCLLARRSGINVTDITLFALGGLARLEGEPATARQEFDIAVAGPVVSALLAAGLLGSSEILAEPSPLNYAVSLLGYINVGLVVFNMVPGFPLDGGRILRAIIWWWTGDRDRATSGASIAGQVAGAAFMLIGIWRAFLGGAGLNGFWMLMIGWFLWQTASASRLDIVLRRTLAGVHAQDLMRREVPTVERFTNLADLVKQRLLKTGEASFAVVDQGKVQGWLTPAEIAGVGRSLWPFRTVDEVMRPLSGSQTSAPDAPVLSALQLMAREHVNQLPVVREDGQLLGLLSRDDVLAYIRKCVQFGNPGGELRT